MKKIFSIFVLIALFAAAIPTLAVEAAVEKSYMPDGWYKSWIPTIVK